MANNLFTYQHDGLGKVSSFRVINKNPLLIWILINSSVTGTTAFAVNWKWPDLQIKWHAPWKEKYSRDCWYRGTISMCFSGVARFSTASSDKDLTLSKIWSLTALDYSAVALFCMNDAAHNSGHWLCSGHFKLLFFLWRVWLTPYNVFHFVIERHFFKAFQFPRILCFINVT